MTALPATAAERFTEECLAIPCADATLVGVLSRPQMPSGAGVLVIVGGPQYRAGSHRQFVLLARALAQRGHAVLRFDYRGMGDSEGPPRDFSGVSRDIDDALLQFRRTMPELRHIALWGLCDGASAALLYLSERPGAAVSGLCLLNPWVRSPQLHASARVKHYYVGRMKESSFWRKLIRGQVGLNRLAEMLHHLKTMLGWTVDPLDPGTTPQSFQQRMAAAWHRGRQPVLLILSGRDLVAQEFLEASIRDPAWHRALDRPALKRLDLPDADHTFSESGLAQAVEQATANWIEQTLLAGPASVRPDTSHGQPRH